METTSVEFINPFVTGAYSILECVLGEEPIRGTLSAGMTGKTSHQVNVIIGITCEAHGHIILGMSLVTADKIATQMVGFPVVTFDALAASALSELTNMICGAAVSTLSEAEYFCDLTPPTLVRGAKVYISSNAIPAIIMPMSTSCGEICLTVALTGVLKTQAAA